MPRSKQSETTKTGAPISKTAFPAPAATAQDVEKLGVFYLGRPYDLVAKKAQPGWFLYDSKDLVTHAVCVGMTGSGKTGLCLALLEEAAIDGIPALIIDPKGDLGNLLLTFPDLRAQDFEPWIDEDEARKNGLSPADYAAKQAETWKNGLSQWGQDGQRIARLRESAEFAIYTPGSNAGLPVSVLSAFSCPAAQIVSDVELLREQVTATVTGLLGLIGIEADPINSPPHILLSAILESVWRRGQNLDLVTLIQQVQTPPFQRLGALDVESFFPSQDPKDNPHKGRFSLAKRLNNLIAAPSFEIWKQGVPLEIDSLLYAKDGKPQVSIFSIAHLNDEERMFFVTIFLTQTLAWMRRQSGTTSLRAILYMDEIFGYFPPVANPPSKQPLLTLLKQGRAFGLGVMLATQNPVDLDYKGLANAGTWFIGRLQTERDKARVLEGLEGASVSSGKKFDRARMAAILAGLGNRIFLMNNVHEEEPVIFETRWVMSYLQGPLMRDQIKTLMHSRKLQVSQEELSNASQDETEPFSDSESLQKQRPLLSPGVPQHFLPIRGDQPKGASLVYQPMLLTAADVRFFDRKTNIDITKEESYLLPIVEGLIRIDWNQARKIEVPLSDLEKGPQEPASYLALPAVAGQVKNYTSWNKEFQTFLYQVQKIELYRSPELDEISRPDESERDFRVRLKQIAHERRDTAVGKLRQKYAPKIAALHERIRRAEQAVEREKEQAKQTGLQTALSVGATILGAFMGRKTISATTIGKATTALGKAGRTMKDVGMAQDNVAVLQQQVVDLEARFKSETEELSGADPQSETLETLALRPTKSNISVKLVALAWLPYWRDSTENLLPAYQ